MRIVSVVGARPNFMKIAPITRAIEKHNAAASDRSPVNIHQLLIHTGQHYDYEMSKVFFEDLALPEPDVYLGVGSGTHAEQTGRVMIELEKVLMREKPDLVVVVGDVNSTLAAALAAVKLHIPVAHVEAGLRSFDREMPEEVNRLLTDHVSEYLFTTSHYDDKSLLEEGIAADRIHRVGNVMVDSLLHSRETAAKSDILRRLGLSERGYALLTLHRPGNVDSRDSLARILAAVEEVASRLPVVFPAHPRTRKRMREFGLLDRSPITSHKSLLVTDPLGYLDFLKLEMNARMVITDSGGMQVETTILGVPCLTLLDSPVWRITEEQGTNRRVGADGARLVEQALAVLEADSRAGAVPELWDGRAAERIVGVLAKWGQRR